MDFSCALDGSRESVKCQVVGGMARAPVWEQTNSYLVDVRRFSKEPSKIGDKLSDFLISLVLGEFFGRPIWGKPTVQSEKMIS